MNTSFTMVLLSAVSATVLFERLAEAYTLEADNSERGDVNAELFVVKRLCDGTRPGGQCSSDSDCCQWSNHKQACVNQKCKMIS